MDAQRAAAGQFGGRIAHGTLLMSVAFGLGAMDVPQPSTVALVGTSWRFLKPVRPGSTVHSVWRLSRKRDVTNANWGLVVWHVELIDHSGERVLEGEVSALVNRRDSTHTAVRGRRRRRGRASGPALPAGTTDGDLPEPAPADTPTPAQRRRTPRPSRPVTTNPAPALVPTTAGLVPSAEAEASPVPPAGGQAGTVSTAPASPSPSRRRRRRRGGGGSASGNGSSPATGSDMAGSVEPARAPAALQPPPSNLEIVRPKLAPEFQAAPEPAPASTWAAPTSVESKRGPDEGNPLGRVLGRLRRPRGGAPTQK